jgi:hypothetical protein
MALAVVLAAVPAVPGGGGVVDGERRRAAVSGASSEMTPASCNGGNGWLERCNSGGLRCISGEEFRAFSCSDEGEK